MNPNKRPPPSSSGGAFEGGDGLVQRDATKRARDVPDGKILRPGQEQPGNVLLVRVTDIVHPVTVLALQQIFSRFGKVNKIVMFDKGSGFQALVQMEDVYSAINAHEAADMQEMYSGCNLIRVGYSNLQNVTVKTNSERSWDFNIGPPLEGALPPGTSVSSHRGSPGIPAPVAAAGHAKSSSPTSHQAAPHQVYSTQQYSPYSAVQQHKQHSYSSPPQQQQHMYTPNQQPYGTPPHSGYPSPQHQPPYNNGAAAAGGGPFGQPVPGAANSTVATVNGSYVPPLAYGQPPYVPPYGQAPPTYPQQSYVSQQPFGQNYPHMALPHDPGDDSSGSSGGAGMGIPGTSGAGAGNYSRTSPPQPQHNPGGGYYPPSPNVMPAQGGPYGSIPYSSERGPGGLGSMSGMGMGRPNYSGRQGGGGGSLGGGGPGSGSGAGHGGRAAGYGGGAGSRGSAGGGLLQPPIHRPLASPAYDNGYGYASRPPVRYRSQDRKSSGASSGGGAVKPRSRVPLLDPRHIQALTPTAAAAGKKSARLREPEEEEGRGRGSSSGRVSGGGAAGGGAGFRSGLVINFVKEKGAQDSIGRKKEATVEVEGKEREGGGGGRKKVRASGSQKRANKREAAEMLGPDTADQLAAATAKVRVSDHQSPAADGSEAGADGESKRANKREAAEMLGADAADQLAAATAKVRVSDDVEEEAEAKAAAREGEGDANEPDSGEKATTDHAAGIGEAQTAASSVDATAVVPINARESTLGVVGEGEGERDEDKKRSVNPAAATATATTQVAAAVLKGGASGDVVGNGASVPGEEGVQAEEKNGIGKSVEEGRRTGGAAVAEIVQDTDNKPAEGGKRASQGRRKGRWNTAAETADGDRKRGETGVSSIRSAANAAKTTLLDEGKDEENAQSGQRNTLNMDDAKSNTANDDGLPGGAKSSGREGNGAASGGSSGCGEPVEEEGGTAEGLTEEETVDGDEAEGEVKAQSQEEEDDAAGDEAEKERVDVGAWAAAAPAERSPILMILHVDGHEVSPGALCQLFGLYGDVMKVKLVASRGMALVQMRYAVQAINAQRLLDQTPLCGMILEIKASSQWTINDPTATDFSEYQGVHRYETVPSPEDSRYRDGLSPPCSTLVIDNVSPDVSAEEITSIFAKHGVVSSVDLDTHAEAPTGTALGNTAPKPSVQALVHMEADGRTGATEAAVHALVMTHNLTLRERRLRVSFLSGDRHVEK